MKNYEYSSNTQGVFVHICIPLTISFTYHPKQYIFMWLVEDELTDHLKEDDSRRL